MNLNKIMRNKQQMIKPPEQVVSKRIDYAFTAYAFPVKFG